MWIQERNGKYRYFERYRDPITGAVKHVSCTLEKDDAKTHRKAAAILQRKISDRLQESCAPDRLTIKTLVSKYAEHQSYAVKESTAKRNAFEGRAVCRILGEDAIVERLTAAYVMSKLLQAGETTTCTNARIKYIKACVRWGYKADLVESPALADKLEYLPDRRKKEKLQTKYMEPEELRAVLDGMKITRWALLTEFLCLSGLRIGELIALKDADVSEKYIHIDKTYDIKAKAVQETPKTDTSNRDVFIQPELADCIVRMRRERKIAMMATGGRSTLFYPDLDGGYLHYESYNKYLKENTMQIIGRTLTPHACRHTMTSIFAAQGIDLSTISRRLGHSGSNVTRDIYLHVTGAQRKKDEAQIARITLLSGG